MTLRDLRKRYPGSVLAVDSVTLDIPRGAHLALLGPSGCGKTTTLLLVSGLEAPDAGEIWIDGRRVAGDGASVPPERRRIGMVFQDYALFPFMTVAQNVGFSLSHVAPQKRARIVRELLDVVGLPSVDDRYPHQLSGGQQQRVALARALAPQPAVVLLDEPFSNLDAGLRQQIRGEVREILRQRQVTTIFVTHDQDEALSASDLVGVMFDGRLEQLAPPEEVYRLPRTRQVAAFVGDASFLAGEANGDRVTCELGTLPLARPALGAVTVMIRPEAVQLGAVAPDQQPHGVVVQREYYGRDQVVHVRLASGVRLRARLGVQAEARPGDRVRVCVSGAVVGLVEPAAGSE